MGGKRFVLKKTAYGVESAIEQLDIEEEDVTTPYFFCKTQPEPAILDIDYYNSKGLFTSFISPIIINGEFKGVVGIDYKLDYIKNIIDSVNKSQESKLMLLSFNGDVVACNNSESSGKNIVEIDTFLSNNFSIIRNIQSAKGTNVFLKDKTGNDSIYYALSTFYPGATKTPWGVLISAPLKSIEVEIKALLLFVRKTIIVGLIFLAIIVFVFTLSIVYPLQRLTKIMLKLSLGHATEDLQIKIEVKDELGEMASSMNNVIDGMSKAISFAESIGKGNFDYSYKPLGDKDALGNAILEMRNSLYLAQVEEDQRKTEEEQLNWTSHGINIFNKVLRVDNQNLEHLAFEIIKTLTLYLDAQMGGLYVKTDEKEQMELIGFIGFAKEKYSQRYIEPGQGLVGRAILERETIFINDIPKDADIISSGLGKAKPKAILIVPLINNLQLVGIIEIASLNAIEPFQIAFVERIVETIASTISTVKTNERTAKLLNKSRKQAEELEQQEEEMRQNMEEMQATQEEAAKRELELSSLIQAFQVTIPIMEYDLKGRVIDVNDEYLKIYKTRKNQLIGKQHKADLFMNEQEQAKHDEFWNSLRKGKIMEQVEFIKSGKEDYWLIERFVPIRDASGAIFKILTFGIDITEQKKTESQIQQVQEGHLTITSGKKGKQKTKKTPTVDFSQELELIDLTYLKMVYKKDAQKIYNILKLYYDSLPSQVKELDEVLKKHDYKGLKVKTSALKTKMSYLGLKKIYEYLGNIERIITDDKNLVEIPKLLNSINEQWQKAYDELSIIINTNR